MRANKAVILFFIYFVMISTKQKGEDERLYFDYGFHGVHRGFGTIVWLIKPNVKKWKFMSFIPLPSGKEY